MFNPPKKTKNIGENPGILVFWIEKYWGNTRNLLENTIKILGYSPEYEQIHNNFGEYPEIYVQMSKYNTEHFISEISGAIKSILTPNLQWELFKLHYISTKKMTSNFFLCFNFLLVGVSQCICCLLEAFEKSARVETTMCPRFRTNMEIQSKRTIIFCVGFP